MGSISKKYVNSEYLIKNRSKIINEKGGKIIIFEVRHANNIHCVMALPWLYSPPSPV